MKKFYQKKAKALEERSNEYMSDRLCYSEFITFTQEIDQPHFLKYKDDEGFKSYAAKAWKSNFVL